ncbi:MAG: serine/threonine protein kinase [Thermoleophilaceae bacterium]|nr:serine/threonine protein kinase [Thermoleophilaceae bacterium]
MNDPLLNTLVDGRYRILNRIGSGGMADVYLAEDGQLGRQVALKMLHRRFAEDQQFVERFKREASSAAALQHPNVVAVFDRGEHEGTYYIAMEHLAGRTLKQVMVDERPLPQERSIDLAIQVLTAAGFAHKRGVVHRDFKPQNVIVDDQDRAKVTDFGIARAGASEMTETGSILGTAQYLSPEQAQGHATGASSDLYSIGVMLFEMVTGRLPFEADSAVAIAVQHLSQLPPMPSDLRPDIHPGLEATILRALAKDPTERWQTADDFIAALQSARAALALGDDGQGTAVWGVVDPAPRRRRWPWVLAGLLAVAAAAAAFVLLSQPVQVRVPNLVERPLAQAEPPLEAAGLKVNVVQAEDPAPVNQVIAQRPAAGARVDEGSTVELTVSAGPATAAIPDVTGLSEKRAIRALNAAGFQTETDEEVSDEIEAGFAIGTLPGAGSERREGTPIQLLISSGPRIEQVPRVIGFDRDVAQSQLEGAGFKVSITKVDSEILAEEVTAQTPEGGTDAAKGSTVNLSISNGKLAGQAVPNVSGLDVNRAVPRLRGDGFRVDVEDKRVRNPVQEGLVLDQDPSAGETLEQGGTVELDVGRFDEPADGR